MLKVLEVIPLTDGRLYVELNNGKKGEVDINPFMQSAYFRQLKDHRYFSQVALFLGGIAWPEGQDLGPDTLDSVLVQRELENSAV